MHAIAVDTLEAALRTAPDAPSAVAPEVQADPDPPHRQPANALVEVDNLLFQRDASFALRIPELRLYPGEMMAVIGANGSGKSSLLACLLGGGVGRASAFDGQVRMLGAADPRAGFAQRHRLGVQRQDAGFNELYRVRDLQELHHRTYARSDAAVFDAFGVPALAKKAFGALSSGEQQRVQLAMALAHHPQLALFDEPTSNLDPHFEDVFCWHLRTRQQDGSGFASLFVTHAGPVAALCDRLLLLHQGAIDRIGPRAALVQERFGSVGCRFTGPAPQLDAAADLLAGQTAVRQHHRDARSLTLYGDAPLRTLAERCLAALDLERFSLWRPGAADLLEAIKHG